MGSDCSNILIIAPHMDDEVLGCGGTIAKHVAAGHHVTVCFVANRAYEHRYDEGLIEREKAASRKAQMALGYQAQIFLDLPDEQLDARQIDVIVPIEKVVGQVRPDAVYFPHRGDYHQDHRAVFEAVRVACRPNGCHFVRSMWIYECTSAVSQQASAGDWPFCPSHYVEISEQLATKVRAMACYEAESRAYPHPRSPEGIRIAAQKRGMEVCVRAAEAFTAYRHVWI